MSETEKVMDVLTIVVDKLIPALVLDIHGEIVEKTPVDTGWARSNWLPSVGRSVVGTVGSPEAIDAGAALEGIIATTKWKLVSGDTIYIVNNVPYIRRLNAGHSKQAPSGFVEKAISRAISKFDRTEL